MRVLAGKYRRNIRRRRPNYGQVATCVMVRHDACVAELRPHTKAYSVDARRALGKAVIRAREAAGYPSQRGKHSGRPKFAAIAGVSVRSLLKLESGDPVGPSVYEAVARALPGWTEDDPVRVLEGGDPPPPQSEPAEEPAPRSALEATLREVPNKGDLTKEELEFMWSLSKLGMSAEEIVDTVQKRRARIRMQSETDVGQVGENGA